MSLVDEILIEMLRATKPDEASMKEARNRRDVVFAAVMTYDGALKTVKSGSIAHGTVSDLHGLIDDADGSLVLNRQVYTAYGPDGDGLGPCDLVNDIAIDLRDLVSQVYENVWVSTNHKHAIFFRFREPMPNGQDSTVDLVISLNRRDKPGLWIPQLYTDTWDAADPAKHHELVRAKRKETNSVSTKVVRASKLYARQWAVPLLSSFHLTALMLASLDKGVGVGQGLMDLFSHGAKTLKRLNTPDPAGVSESLKIPATHGRDKVVSKLEKAVARLERAIALESTYDENYDEITEHLSKVFWQSDAKAVLLTAAEKVKVLRSIKRATSTGGAVAVAVGVVSVSRPVVSARAFGWRG